MRILITGASGFVGTHVAQELLQNKHEVMLTSPDKFELNYNGRVLKSFVCDLRNPKEIQLLVMESKPDAVIHLAGMSHVVQGNEMRARLIELNVLCTHNVCAAIWGTDIKTTMLLVSSAYVFPLNHSNEESFSETSEESPESPYGFSKLAAEMVVKSYASDLFSPYVVRPFNHIGPGQALGFVCPGLARRIHECEKNGNIEVGNLDSARDFTDVRDVARAYRLIIEKKPKETLFVLGSGKATSVRTVFEKLTEISGKKINPVVNEGLVRTGDPRCMVADAALAKKVLGWQPEISLEKSLKDIYDDVKSR